jgi:hypothetical protein
VLAQVVTPTFISSTASSALRPRWGECAAWEALPWKTNFAWMLASVLWLNTPVKLAGCQVSAVSTSSNTPARAMKVLPEPPSSAGHP